jgi:hypothetical protein
MNLLLQVTTITQSNLNQLFAEVDRTGKTATTIVLQGAQVEVLFIDDNI